jgi:hypothetical protein
MIVYPMSDGEEAVVRFCSRAMFVVAVLAVIALTVASCLCL